MDEAVSREFSCCYLFILMYIKFTHHFPYRMNCDGVARTWHSANFLPERQLLLCFGGEKLDVKNDKLVTTDEVMVLDTEIMLWYPPSVSGQKPSGRGTLIFSLPYKHKHTAISHPNYWCAQTQVDMPVAFYLFEKSGVDTLTFLLRKTRSNDPGRAFRLSPA